MRQQLKQIQGLKTIKIKIKIKEQAQKQGYFQARSNKEKIAIFKKIFDG